jgi:hypothetical protein
MLVLTASNKKVANAEYACFNITRSICSNFGEAAHIGESDTMGGRVTVERTVQELFRCTLLAREDGKRQDDKLPVRRAVNDILPAQNGQPLENLRAQ